MEKLSFIIPCYKSQDTIKGVVAEIENVVSGLGYEHEIILVNDCSPDNTWSVINQITEQNDKVMGISFSKNFGQASAILAGFSKVTGDYVVCLDDDGQTPIDELPKLLSKLKEGYDVVFSKYGAVKQKFWRNFTSKINAYMAHVLTEKPNGVSTASFFVMRSFIAHEIIKYDCPYPYISGLIFRITHNAANVEVKHRKRKSGESGYTFTKLFKLWLNGFTSFSVKPLRLSVMLGIIFAFGGFAMALFTIFRKLLNPAIQTGYSSMIALIALLGGVILFCMGGVGEYIGRCYMCINRTPQYVIKDTTIKEGEGFENGE